MNKISGLYSLRFFACIIILLSHAFPSFKLGYLSLEFFFVLSSFLLTILALREIEQSGTVNRFNFFMRRTLRVFPLYFALVAFSLLILPYFADYFHIPIKLPEEKWKYWLFLSNFEYSDSIYAIKFLWSVSVEEQFYWIFIPISFLFSKNFWIPVILFALTSIAFLIYAEINDLSIHTHTLAHFIKFAAGMALGYLFHKKYNLLKPAYILFFTTGIGLFLTWNNNIIFPILSSIFFASTIILTVHLAKNKTVSKLLMPFECLGIYTYGIYLFSGFVLTAGGMFLSDLSKLPAFFIELGCLLLISIISYHCYEKPFLKLKKYFRK